MEQAEWTNTFAPHYRSEVVGGSLIVHADCFEWLQRIPEQSLHAIVTDPPYGVKEYELDQIEKRTAGKGGIWRIPPALDGNTRSPLPRFTALNDKEREVLREFFVLWGRTLIPALRPGAHVFIASNSFLSQMVFTALVEGGLSFGARSSGWCVPCGAETGPRTPKRSSPTCVLCHAADTNRGACSGNPCRPG